MVELAESKVLSNKDMPDPSKLEKLYTRVRPQAVTQNVWINTKLSFIIY